MASAPQAAPLPLFYNALEPLSSNAHAAFRLRTMEAAPFLATQHAIPVTVDEFIHAQRSMPIVFTDGDDSIPIALMGLNEGVNVFVDNGGKLIDEGIYVPAYVRRYPFMLARLTPDAQELSLCFDPTADAIGTFDDGQALFTGDQPTEVVQSILQFNEMFEQAGMRTANFMKELRELDLLMAGEVSIQPEGAEQPFIYRGFQMVSEEKLNDLRGDQLRKIQKSGMLPLLHAHLFSLQLMPNLFEKQVRQGKMPTPQLAI
ncbi:SapC family protein [Sphingomonas immobilis]|uniref:SapC family protein n=1 Tax=Sphingomonas immobilis TaxID=3063997 RepID=A0ABT8ZY76_9SPHN|nr:SapC family protein [Sphingomonas sp. CA1-15]MDO7842516.1 SapC family protein [Sphingomonas sp. CA1-15]